MLSYTQCSTIQRPSQSTPLIYFRVITTALKTYSNYTDTNSIRNLQILPFHAFFVTKVFKSDKLLKMGHIQNLKHPLTFNAVQPQPLNDYVFVFQNVYYEVEM